MEIFIGLPVYIPRYFSISSHIGFTALHSAKKVLSKVFYFTDLANAVRSYSYLFKKNIRRVNIMYYLKL